MPQPALTGRRKIVLSKTNNAPASPRRARPVGRGRGPALAEAASVRVLRQFRAIFNAVKTHFQQVEKSVGLGGAQVWALSVIQASPGCGVGDLASAMSVHPSTASNLVKALVERDLVAASRDPVDRRVTRLRLLAAGARVLRRVPGPFAGILPEALSGLDSRTLRRLEDDLAKVIAKLPASRRLGEVPLGQR